MRPALLRISSAKWWRKRKPGMALNPAWLLWSFHIDIRPSLSGLAFYFSAPLSIFCLKLILNDGDVILLARVNAIAIGFLPNTERFEGSRLCRFYFEKTWILETSEQMLNRCV